MKLSNDPEVRRGTKRFAEDVEDHWKRIAPSPGDAVHPYATGAYQASIQNVQTRDTHGRFASGWKVFTNHPNAVLLEYGTRPDTPGGHATWIDLDGERHWGPYTPTPAFAFAARTALAFGGTAP